MIAGSLFFHEKINVFLNALELDYFLYYGTTFLAMFAYTYFV